MHGAVHVFVTPDSRTGVVLELSTTEWGAATDVFRILLRDLCHQIAVIAPEDIITLLASKWIQNGKMSILDRIRVAEMEIKSVIRIVGFARRELGCLHVCG